MGQHLGRYFCQLRFSSRQGREEIIPLSMATAIIRAA